MHLSVLSNNQFDASFRKLLIYLIFSPLNVQTLVWCRVYATCF